MGKKWALDLSQGKQEDMLLKKKPGFTLSYSSYAVLGDENIFGGNDYYLTIGNRNADRTGHTTYMIGFDNIQSQTIGYQNGNPNTTRDAGLLLGYNNIPARGLITATTSMIGFNNTSEVPYESIVLLGKTLT